MAFIPKDAKWYLADVVLEHRIEGDDRNVVHVNLHLVEAASPEQAYEKAMALGREAEMAYPNTDGKEVRVVFRGLRGLNVIHEGLIDGAELAYSEHIAVPETKLREWSPPREKLAVFEETRRTKGVPNYAPESVMRMLEEEGFTREELERGA